MIRNLLKGKGLEVIINLYLTYKKKNSYQSMRYLKIEKNLYQKYVQKLYNIALQRSHEMPDTMLERYHSEQNIINKPFHLKGTCDTCVILVHGWSSTLMFLKKTRSIRTGLN